MKKQKNYSFFFILLLLLNTSSVQWIQTDGPFGGHIYSIAVSDDFLIAGTSMNGVFYSVNNGNNWK